MSRASTSPRRMAVVAGGLFSLVGVGVLAFIWLLSPRGAGAHTHQGDGWWLLDAVDECCGTGSPVFADDETSLLVLWEASLGSRPEALPELDWTNEVVIGLTHFHDSCGPSALRGVVVSGSGQTEIQLRVAGPRGPLLGGQDCDAIAIPQRFLVVMERSRLGRVVTHHPSNAYGIEIDLDSGQSWSLVLEETDGDEMVNVRDLLPAG